MSSSVERQEIDPIAREIRALHLLITESLRKSVKDGVRIGGLLEQKKAELEHGFFLTWIHEECGFTDRTARRYMQLHRWREKLIAKTDSVSDLTEAYRRVELLENKPQKKQDPPPAAAKPVQAPPSSTTVFHQPRETEPVVERDPEEPRDRPTAQPAPFRGPTDAEWKEKMARFRKEDAELKDKATRDEAESDRIRQVAGEYLREAAAAAEKFSHLTLSGGADNALQDTMLQMLERYVMSFGPTVRRVEVAHNLIKGLRVLIHEINGEEASA